MTDSGGLDPSLVAANNNGYPDVGAYCMLTDELAPNPLHEGGQHLHEGNALAPHPHVLHDASTQIQQMAATADSVLPNTNHDPDSGGATFGDLLEATGAAYHFEHFEAPQQEALQPESKKRRICRFPGCDRVIKSQGHCQRHGASVKRCKVDGCEKQVQGTFQGMCKRHWREATYPTAQETQQPEQPPPPMGESVYDTILPQSITYKPTSVGFKLKPQPDQQLVFEEGVPVMPLVMHLRNNAHKEFAWHRAEERRARGCFPHVSTATRLENWERQLVLVEILLLSGGTPFANFKDLAHAWGRERNFHTTLAASIFERRGDLERKRRSDAGKPKAKRLKMDDGFQKQDEEMMKP